MPKLHLKRTPEEEARHRLHKKERKEAKRKRRHHNTYDTTEPGTSHSRKRQRATAQEPPLAGEEGERKWASSDEDEEQYGPQPAPSTGYSTQTSRLHHSDEDKLRAEEEELRFKERLCDAFADDERLDSLEAKLNDFAHVPDRWRTSSSTRARFNVFESDDWLKVDPATMDEEEYTEWIRMGMYRKTHGDEYAEQQRQKAAQTARRAEEKARREETTRLEKAAEEERQQKKRERDSRRWDYARDAYHAKWKTLLNAPNGDRDTLPEIGFCDIPWPILQAHKERGKHKSKEQMGLSFEDLTLEAISAFLLPNAPQDAEKSRKEVLRETFLRFHPDKFEGRFMKTVRKDEQESVREGIGRVVRVLNTLMQ